MAKSNKATSGKTGRFARASDGLLVFERQHFFSFVSVLIVAAMLLWLKQLYNVLFQPPGELFGPDWKRVSLWLIYQVCLFPIGWWLIRIAAPPLPAKPKNRLLLFLSSLNRGRTWLVLTLLGLGLFVAANFGESSIDPEQSLIARLKVGVPLLLIAFAAGLFVLPKPLRQIATRLSVALHVRFSSRANGPLNGMRRVVDRLEEKNLRFLVETILRVTVGAYGLVLVCAGRIIWWIATSSSLVSERMYTVGAMWLILFFLLAVGRALDGLTHHYRNKPVRLMVYFVLAIAAISMGPTRVGRIEKDAATPFRNATKTNRTWTQAFASRVQQLEEDEGPFVIVAASGGGSRAALFTSLVLQRLRNEPAGTNPNGPSLADRIVLISSVSGGSVAAAHYVSSEAHHSLMPRDHSRPWRNTLVGDLRERVHSVAKGWLFDLEHAGQPTAQPKREHGEATAAEASAVLTRLSLPPDEKRRPDPLEWIFASEYIDDMNTDFMAPMLRGLIEIGDDRGEALSNFWEQRFGWADSTNDRPFLNDAHPHPLLILNAALVHEGQRLAMGFPRLSTALFDENGRGVTSLSFWNPGLQLTLAESVRLSSNFPWGLPLATAKYEGVPDRSGEMLVVDGGVVDNTGVDTLAAVLRGLIKLKDKSTVAAVQSLRARGVLLIEIDSGAKPQTPSWLASQMPEVFLPPHALGTAAFATATRVKADYLNHITDAFEPNREAPNQHNWVGLHHVRFQCNQNENIMTSWALGPFGKAKVIVRFLIEDAAMMPVIRKHLATFRAIRSCGTMVEAQAKAADLEQRGNAARDKSSDRQRLFESHRR